VVTGGAAHEPAGQDARGDAEASFSAWFKESFEKLQADLMRSGVGREQARDAAADACEDMFGRWGQVQYPYAYARRTAIHVVIKARERGDQRLRQRMIDKGAVSEGSEDPGLTAWEDRQWVTGLIAGLPPAQREVVSCIVDEFTPAEAAVLLGRTAAAVRRALADARRKLEREVHPQRRAAGRPGAGQAAPAAMTASEENR
jgi:DNA-directed RNA polymerase specialized sigma24 family protein